ncbi:50S ribosomal protein L3 [Abyssibacter sp.]|uniref:50S ribosomal protein L3 n=1 Tax=Abyssibacter sp. TaxID=2320200 RepID=UPI0035155139
MSFGLVGKKRGMTRLFTEAGVSVPVTVIEVEPNRITQIKSDETDGYTAVQVTIGERRATRVTKAMAGHFKKAGTEAGRGVWEFRASAEQLDGLQAGAEVKVDQFEAGQTVDVTGISIGKGFAGTIKRHNFHHQRMSHGNSLSHRAPGSIGQNQTPGRVFKGKKMAGQMGNKRVTVQNLEVVRVDAERNLLLVKGGIPGAAGADVLVRLAVKG